MKPDFRQSPVDSALTRPLVAESAAPRGDYTWWRSAAENLLAPLSALMQPGKADLPLQGQASNHGAQADRLESFARPCLLAAHWLASEPGASEKLSRDEIAAWFRRGLVIGTDPSNPETWGPTTNHHQHTVEMAALTLALQIARPFLWEPLSKSDTTSTNAGSITFLFRTLDAATNTGYSQYFITPHAPSPQSSVP